MKKIIAVFLIIVLTLTMCTPVFAQNKEDLFFHDYTKTPKLKEYFDNKNEQEWVLNAFVDLLKKYVLKEGEQPDISKIEFKYKERLFAHRALSPQKVLELMKAENKLEYLYSIEPENYTYPAYYDGEYIQHISVEYKKKIDAFTPRMPYDLNDLSYWYFAPHRDQKEEIAKILEQKNYIGYEILQPTILGKNEYAIVQKDGECYLIKIMNNLSYLSYIQTNRFTEKNTELLEKDILTIPEVELLVKSWNEIDKQVTAEALLKNPNGEVTNENGGSSMPDQPESSEPIDESQNTDVKQPEQQVTNNEQSKPMTDNVETPKTDSQTQMAEPETITTGSNVETVTPEPLEVEDDDLQKSEFPYWIIGVIVGVIAIAAVTVIVIKKKKA